MTSSDRAIRRHLLQVCRYFRRSPGCAGLLLALAILPVYGYMIGFVSFDVRNYFQPWLDYIQAHGYWRSLSDPFHLFTGLQISFLMLFAYLDPLLDDLVIIKLVPIAAVLVTALAVHRFARAHGDPRVPPSLAAGLFMLLPTVAMNSAQWGQVEIYFTGCLILSLHALLRGNVLIGILFYGLSISFKLQAAFFGPFLLFMMFRHGVSLAYLALIPLIYVLSNLVPIFAGRPFGDVMMIYLAQGAELKTLSAGAPNPWLLVREGLEALSQRLYGDEWLAKAVYLPLVLASLTVSFVLGLRLALLGRRQVRLDRCQLVALAALSVALMPYALPKMHDRYFFAADALTFLLALCRPSLWYVAIFFQLGSGFIYIDAFYGPALGEVVQRVFNLLAILFVSAGLMALLLIVARAFGASRSWWPWGRPGASGGVGG